MNKVLLVGRVANDVSYNKSNSGITYLRTSIAINRRGSQDQTDFIPIIAWRNTADFMNSIITKGVLVSIEGSLISSSYQNSEGRIIRTYEVNVEKIQLLESKATVQNRNSGNFANYQQNPNSKYVDTNNYNEKENIYPNYKNYSGSIKKSQNPTFGENKNLEAPNKTVNEVKETSWEDFDMNNIDTLD